MTSPFPYQNVDEFAQQLGDEIFGANFSQNLIPPQDPNYPQNSNYPPPTYPNYPTNSSTQDPNYCPPQYNYSSGTGGSNSTVPKIIFTNPTPNSNVPASSQDTVLAGKKRKKYVSSKYTAAWWRFYERTEDADSAIISATCKVRGAELNTGT